MKRLAFLIFLCATSVFAQTNFGGYIAPPPRPTVSGANLTTNPGFTVGTGGLTGYHASAACGGVVTDANAPSGKAFQLIGTISGGTCNFTLATVTLEIEAGVDGNGNFGLHDGEAYSIEISTSSTFNGQVSTTLADGSNGSLSAGFLFENPLFCPTGSANGCSTGGLVSFVGPGQGYITYQMSQFPVKPQLQGDKMIWIIKISNFDTGSINFTNTVMKDWYTPVQNFVTIPNNSRGYFYTDFSYPGHFCGQLDSTACAGGTIAGVAEIDPPPGLTASTLTVKMATVSDCSSGVVQTFTKSSPVATQWWSIASGLSPQTTPTTADYICPTATWSDATTATFPSYKFYPLDATFRATLNNYIDQDNYWNHNGVSRMVWTAADRIPGSREDNVSLYTTKAGYETGLGGVGVGLLPTAVFATLDATQNLTNAPTYGPGCGLFATTTAASLTSNVVTLTFAGSPGISAGTTLVSGFTGADTYFNGTFAITGAAGSTITYSLTHANGTATTTGTATFVNCATPTLFTDFSANRFDAAEWGITSVQACNPTGGVGVDQCTPFMQAANDYNMGSWETMQGKYGYLLSHTATVPTLGPSPPTLVSSSSTGGTISAAFVFVEVSAWDQSYFGVGGNSDQMKDTLPSTALTVGPLTGTTNQFTITPPACGDRRTYGFHTWIATNTTSTVPAQSAFFLADPTAEGETCGANVNFTSVPPGGSNPPTIDSTNSAIPTWCSGCTDTTAYQDTAQTMNSQPGSGFLYVTDEDFATAAEFVWQQTQTIYNFAPGVITWSNEGGSANCTAAGRQRFIVDVVGCDPYGDSQLSDKTDLFYMYGNAAKRVCLVYTGPFNFKATVAQCDVTANATTWLDYMGRTTYGSRALNPYFWDALALSELSIPYSELWRSVWDTIVEEKSRGNGMGLLSWGWISAAGMTATVQQWQDIQAWLDFRHASDDLMNYEKILIQEPVDATYLDCDQTFDPGAPGCTGTVDGASGLTLNGGVVLANIKSGSTATLVCGTGSGVINTTFWPANFAQFFTEKDPATSDQYIWFADLCNSGNSATPTAPVMTFTLANVPAGATAVEAKNSGGSYTLTLTSVSCPVADTQAHSCATFTDTWGATQASGTVAGTDMDAYQYIVRVPRGMRIGN